MKKSLLPYLTMALLTAEVQAFAVPQAGLCPAEINATSIELKGISPEWKSNVANRLRWDAATFLGSPPEQKIFLKPDTRKLTKATWARFTCLAFPRRMGTGFNVRTGKGMTSHSQGGSMTGFGDAL